MRASCLATEGPFSLLNALRTLDVGATHSLRVCFLPHLVHEVTHCNIDCVFDVCDCAIPVCVCLINLEVVLFCRQSVL